MKAFFRALFGLLFLLGTASETAYAQRHPFYNLNVENGLLQSQARGLAQDTRGYLWIATLGGLSRYDGKNFRNYTVRDGLPGNTLIAVSATRDGAVWVGGLQGLARFDGKSFRSYPLGAKKAAVLRLKTDPNGSTVWVLAGGEVASISGNKVAKHPISDAPATAFVRTPDSALWVAVAGGKIYGFRKRDTLLFQVPQKGGRHQIVLDLRADSRGGIWVATRNGLYQISGTEVVPARLGNRFLDNLPPITSLTEDRNGALWGGMTSGAFRLDDSTLTFFNKSNGLTDNTIQSLLTDAEGNIWLATDGQGVYRYSGTQFTALDESTGLPNAQVMSIAADTSGNLFLGTYESGLFRYANGQVKPLLFSGNPPVTALRYWDGALWIGTGGAGLWKYQKGIFSLIPQTETHLQSSLITALYPDAEGRLWIGTGNGVSYRKGGQFFAAPLSGESILDFIQIGQDSLLVAAGSGLKMIRGDKAFPFRTGSAPDSATPQCFTRQGDALWIGTSDNGLIYYPLKNGKTRVFNKRNGLQSDFIYNVVCDDNGDVWAGTGYGIHRIRYSGNGSAEIRAFGKSQGIVGMESNHNAVLKMADGSLWFGTTNGALHYRPDQPVVKARPLSVQLQSVAVFGEPVTDTSWYAAKDPWNDVPVGLRLPFKKNNLTFTFGGISLSGSEALRYRYQLEGLDAPWSDWAATNTVTFSALPPGHYTLLVQSSVAGQPGPVGELRYPFEIITPFHKTIWARLLILAGCILLGIIIQYLIHRQKRAREKLIETLRREEQAKVRARTAEDFHDEVGNKLTRIHVLTNVLAKKIELSPDAGRILGQIQDAAAQLYGGTRDILWSLQPSNDTLYEILLRIRDFGNDLFGDTEVQFHFSPPDERWRTYRLPLDVSRNLIMIFKEALNNTLKYAGATEVGLEVSLDGNTLHLTLTDNGCGFDPKTVKRGNGLANMDLRARRMGGTLAVQPGPGKGTVLRLKFGLPVATNSS